MAVIIFGWIWLDSSEFTGGFEAVWVDEVDNVGCSGSEGGWGDKGTEGTQKTQRTEGPVPISISPLQAVMRPRRLIAEEL